jgi:hypothetical protein
MAPYLALFLAFCLQGLRHLRHSRFRFAVLVSRAAPVVCLVTMLAQAVSQAGSAAASTANWSARRAAIAEELAHSPDKHLIIVRYARDHNPTHIAGGEWVYNEADIDHAKVVWAREMTPEKNAALVRYFGDRKVWLLEPDVQPVELRPYRLEAALNAK